MLNIKKVKIKNKKEKFVKILMILAGFGLLLTTFLPFLPYLI